jgi:hypothetical protein
LCDFFEEELMCVNCNEANMKEELLLMEGLYKWKRAAGRILQLLLTNPLNSQLDTNVALPTVGKKWISPVGQSLL